MQWSQFRKEFFGIVAVVIIYGVLFFSSKFIIHRIIPKLSRSAWPFMWLTLMSYFLYRVLIAHRIDETDWRWEYRHKWRFIDRLFLIICVIGFLLSLKSCLGGY